MDKSFEGLLLSIFLHIILVLILWNAKSPSSLSERPTEITLVEKPTEKSKKFVTETDKKETFEKLKDQADFLSQFTKRVKKQVVAKMIAPSTINAAPQPSQQAAKEQQRKHAAGMQQQNKEPGETTKSVQEPNQAMRNLTIGQSSISENITGVAGATFTALNTDQFTYYTFYARMGQQMRNRWVADLRNYTSTLSQRQLEALSARDRTTVVEILLKPDGQFSGSVVQNSCGDRGLDDVAVQAFRDAAPFPNPPHGMVGSDGLIHIYAALTVYFRPPSFGPAG